MKQYVIDESDERSIGYSYTSKDAAACGVSVTRPYSTDSRIQDSIVRTGWKILNHTEYLKRHENIVTPYGITSTRGGDCSFSFNLTSKTPKMCSGKPTYATWRAYGEVNLKRTSFRSDSTAQQDAENEALSKAWSSASSVMTSFDSMVSLGELRETLAMLKNPLKGIADLTRKNLYDTTGIMRGYAASLNFKKLPKRRKKREILNRLNDQYLQWQYGVQPLKAEVDGLIASLRESNIDYGVAHGRSTRTSAGPLSESSWTNYTLGGMACQRQIITIDKVVYGTSYSIGLRFSSFMEGDKEAAIRSADRFGFTLRNFVPTMWNLLPYSFCLDYISNSASLADSFSVPERAIFYGSKTVVKRATCYTAYKIRPAVNSTWNGPELLLSAVTENFVLQRTSQPGLDIPEFQLKLPTVGQAFNMASLGTAYALARRATSNAYNA